MCYEKQPNPPMNSAANSERQLDTITSSSISIVIQGPIVEGCALTHTTLDVIRAWRKILPDSQIILSTWGRPQFDIHEVDILVVNKDPGVTIPKNTDKGTLDNNIGRQIVSTVGGLKMAQKKFAIKTRTDLMPTGIGFIPAFLGIKERNPKYCIFNHPVITCRYCSLNPLRAGVSLHISDIFHFGETIDLMTLWDIPVPKSHADQAPASFCLDSYGRILTMENGFLRPEQYITLSLIQKNNKKIKLNHSRDNNAQTRLEGECFIFNNFIIRDHDKIGINLPDRMLENQNIMGKIYSNHEISFKEKQLCDTIYSTKNNFLRREVPVSNIAKYWRSMPYDIRIPCLISAILVIIQHPNIIWKTNKMAQWINYRREGRRLIKNQKAPSWD